MTDCLVIFAAGKSTRFGGFPKAFCRLGQIRNVENTISLAKPHFQEIYLVVNQETFASGITDGLDAGIISIVTGQGDAHSILKALKQIRAKSGADTVTACWGDAVFLSDEPFTEQEAGVSLWAPDSPVLVGCSEDIHPYAWFDVDGRKITFSHFQKREPKLRESGLHDQSVFVFKTELLIQYLERFKRHLGLDQYDEDSYDAARGEMGLLDAFSWFHDRPDMAEAEYCELTANRVLSFNTPEELALIEDRLREFRR